MHTEAAGIAQKAYIKCIESAQFVRCNYLSII
jgi:hypothetical protein